MHRCIGNDDFENKKIYEESVKPEGIRKTIALKENTLMHDFTNMQKRVPVKKLSPKKLQYLNKTNNENKVIVEIVGSIVFIVFFMLFIFIILS